MAQRKCKRSPPPAAPRRSGRRQNMLMSGKSSVPASRGASARYRRRRRLRRDRLVDAVAADVARAATLGSRADMTRRPSVWPSGTKADGHRDLAVHGGGEPGEERIDEVDIVRRGNGADRDRVRAGGWQAGERFGGPVRGGADITVTGDGGFQPALAGGYEGEGEVGEVGAGGSRACDLPFPASPTRGVPAGDWGPPRQSPAPLPLVGEVGRGRPPNSISPRTASPRMRQQDSIRPDARHGLSAPEIQLCKRSESVTRRSAIAVSSPADQAKAPTGKAGDSQVTSFAARRARSSVEQGGTGSPWLCA